MTFNSTSIVLSVALLFASLSGISQKETVSIKTNIYCDHCKKCESCGPRLYNQLMDVQGVRKVDIKADDEVIEVTYNTEKIDVKAIRDAINDAGFDADDQPAPEEAVAKLDGCCKKG